MMLLRSSIFKNIDSFVDKAKLLNPENLLNYINREQKIFFIMQVI